MTGLLVNAPAYVAGPEDWKTFWRFNSDRTADLARQATGLADQLRGDLLRLSLPIILDHATERACHRVLPCLRSL